MINMLEYGFWFLSFFFGGITLWIDAFARIWVNRNTSLVDSYEIDACPEVSLTDLFFTYI